MRSRRTAFAAILLVASAVVAPLVGVGVANAVRPVIPPAPARSQDPSAVIEPMPAAPTTTRSVTDAFEPLPIVTSDPGPTPRPFVQRYRTVTVTDPAGLARLLDTAIAGIRVGRSARAVTAEFVAALVYEPQDAGGDVSTTGTDFEGDAFRSLAGRAMTGIAATPTNAIALNDLAVAIFTNSLEGAGTDAPGTPGARPLAILPQLRAAASKLLELGLASFPDDRAMTINQAFLQSVETHFDAANDPTIPGLQRYVGSAPSDVAARSLLASFLVQADPGHAIDRAIALAQPLVDGAETEAAGRLVLGDALLQAAAAQIESGPFIARSLALRGLAEYDRVIGTSGDPAAYAGRATALDLLGQRGAAIEAQREATARTPSSVPWRIHLAQLEACDGRSDAWRHDAEEALRLAIDTRASPLAATRFLAVDAPGPGYRGYSVGSNVAPWRVATLETGGGGATVVKLDPFPVPATCMANVDTDTVVDTAGTEAWLAALASGDLDSARRTLDVWLKAASPTDAAPDQGLLPTDFKAVLDLLEGGSTSNLDPEADPFTSFLELAHRLPADVEGRICARLTGLVGSTPEFVDGLAVCTAESAHRTGDREGAVRAIERVIRLDDPLVPTPGERALQAGVLNELAGHLDAARARYEIAATQAASAVPGLMRLGDLDLLEGDASGALDHYSLAIAAIRSQIAGEDGAVMEVTTAGAARQYLDNNRGIALLMTARDEADAPPDCVAHPAICQRARGAFAAAKGADPKNPVFAMNVAWIARLSGDAVAATSGLEEALANGTPLAAAAHNDLGVLAARRGDFEEAGAQFLQAIEAEPGYDLATWNLGVLDAREAGPVLVAGQASLSDAGIDNGALRTKSVSFLTDERVYRVEVRGDKLELARAPGSGAAAGAAAFGAIAAVGAIGQFLAGLGSPLEDTAGSIVQASLSWGERLRRRLPRVRASWPSWFAWLPAIVVLVSTTAWTASWVAPDAFATAVLIGLGAAALSLVVHACGHLVVAGWFGASLRPSRWDPGIALALVGMPFHVPAGPFLAEGITSRDPGASWWVSVAGVLANLAAAGIALAVYEVAPMPFLRVLAATQLAVAAFALIPSEPLDGSRLATHPVVLALISIGVAAASIAVAVGVI